VGAPLFSAAEIRRRIVTRMGTTTGTSWRRAKEHWKNRCAYCGATGRLQRDHVLAITKGGRDEPRNVVPACEKCNQDKSNLPLAHWMKSRGLNYPLFLVRWYEFRRRT
jgi:5-methylcytosine-specific restriction endonuclease McrA